MLTHFRVVLHVVFPVDLHFLGVAMGSLTVFKGSGCGAGLIMAYLLTPTYINNTVLRSAISTSLYEM